MAKFSAIALFMVAFAMVTLNLTVERGEALTCSKIGASLGQCAAYATGKVAEPSSGCCSAIQGLRGIATTTADRRQMCSCLKQSASQLQDVQVPNIAAIPQKCGVPAISFSADPNFDCNSVN